MFYQVVLQFYVHSATPESSYEYCYKAKIFLRAKLVTITSPLLSTSQSLLQQLHVVVHGFISVIGLPLIVGRHTWTPHLDITWSD